MKKILQSKKFWTLVTTIVAALAAYFCVGCMASARVQKHGVHIDTVRTDYNVRSKNFQVVCNQPSEIRSLPGSSPLKAFTRFMKPCTICSGIPSAPRMSGTSYSSIFLSPSMTDFRMFLLSCGIDRSIISIIQLLTSPVAQIQSSSKSRSDVSGNISFLTAMFLPFGVSRRGGRRGKPRPKIKTIPLGGSHL